MVADPVDEDHGLGVQGVGHDGLGTQIADQPRLGRMPRTSGRPNAAGLPAD
jgi:hypothetical protein